MVYFYFYFYFYGWNFRLRNAKKFNYSKPKFDPSSFKEMIARFARSLQFRYFWWKRKYLSSEFIWKEMFNKYKQFEKQWLELGNGFFWTVNKDRRKAACGTETIGVKYKVVYYCHGAKNSWQHAVGLSIYLFLQCEAM